MSCGLRTQKWNFVEGVCCLTSDTKLRQYVRKRVKCGGIGIVWGFCTASETRFAIFDALEQKNPK